MCFSLCFLFFAWMKCKRCQEIQTLLQNTSSQSDQNLLPDAEKPSERPGEADKGSLLTPSSNVLLPSDVECGTSLFDLSMTPYGVSCIHSERSRQRSGRLLSWSGKSSVHAKVQLQDIPVFTSVFKERFPQEQFETGRQESLSESVSVCEFTTAYSSTRTFIVPLSTLY